MKRTVPLLITFIAGTVLIIAAFVPLMREWRDEAMIWFNILAAVAFVLGGGSLLKMHLRRISDQQPGWGYSAVILVSFLTTLMLGFLKFGAYPSGPTERYGQVKASLPLQAFPVTTTVEGRLPPQQPPAVVKEQLSEDQAAGTVTFRGWMREAQREALRQFEWEAGWHQTVDELYAQAQPPGPLEDRVEYHAQLAAFFFQGVMSSEDRDLLLDLGDDPRWVEAVRTLEERSNRTHRVRLAELPAGITIPEEQRDVVEFDPEQQELRITGPMSVEQRDALTEQFPPGPPSTPGERDELRSELEARGSLTSEQVVALEEFEEERPTIGQRNRALMLALLKPRPDTRQDLTAGQKQFLLAEYNQEAFWRMKVGELFDEAHQEKYRWSAPYQVEGSALWFIYEFVLWPLTSTMFALLAFYVASAAFRAFRAKNLEASLLLVTAFIVLLGRTYAGTFVTAWVPDEWYGLTFPGMSVTIMSVFVTAGNRAIMIGIALGIVSTSLKILLGIDRSYLGSDD